MEKIILNPASLAKPIGYAHGVRTEGGRLLFIAGQTGMDSTSKIVSPGDMAAQFDLALSNMQTVVTEAGGKMTDIVKLTIFITDKSAYLSNLKGVGEAYKSYFGRYYPAMTLVEVKSLFDDEALIEIEGKAVIDLEA
jgi:enamine deaminase RidA (YjgF/YER057c/UK114 family)